MSTNQSFHIKGVSHPLVKTKQKRHTLKTQRTDKTLEVLQKKSIFICFNKQKYNQSCKSGLRLQYELRTKEIQKSILLLFKCEQILW